MSSSDTVSVLTLFPYAPNTLLVTRQVKFKVLNFLDFFLEHMLETIELFCVEQRYEQFDPHVGETLCQIRGYHILWLAQQAELHSKLKQAQTILLEIKSKVSESLNLFKQSFEKYSKTLHGQLNNHEAVQEFLVQYQLEFFVPLDLVYLVACLILTKFRYIYFDPATAFAEVNYNMLVTRLPFGKGLVEKLVRHLQCLISNASCEFIKNLSEELRGSIDAQILLSLLKRQDVLGRTVFSALEVTQILVAHLLQSGHPIVIIAQRYADIEVDTVTMLFVPNAQKTAYILEKRPEWYVPEMPCYTITGVVLYSDDFAESRESFINRFVAIGWINVLLENAAVHPPYSAAEFKWLESDPYQALRTAETVDFAILSAASRQQKTLTTIRSDALKNGCCAENPSLFLVRHIFCATLEYGVRREMAAQKTYLPKVLPSSNYTELQPVYAASR